VRQISYDCLLNCVTLLLVDSRNLEKKYNRGSADQSLITLRSYRILGCASSTTTLLLCSGIRRIDDSEAKEAVRVLVTGGEVVAFYQANVVITSPTLYRASPASIPSGKKNFEMEKKMQFTLQSPL